MEIRRGAAVAVLALVAAQAVACGDEPGPTLEIISPTEGAQVSVPFEVSIDTSASIGPSEDEQHHVHVWFGDNENAYQVVETDLTQITNAPIGEHVMHASLRNPDHSRAGVETSIRVIVVE